MSVKAMSFTSECKEGVTAMESMLIGISDLGGTEWESVLNATVLSAQNLHACTEQ